LVSGTAGMSLATVIRMEFAYPGVGILAGDIIQYLSIATAHGVIMVFFMIMPAIFGAFGNFLLPTQLGVHDVAFPRLNSAAFWFLPGGLIMLCQLVCVDRRYQRMNCFNIRELQGILKRKFFTDLVNTSDNHMASESTLINMRFKNNMSNILMYDQSLFYNFDLTTTSKFKNFSFTPGNIYSYSNHNSTLLPFFSKNQPEFSLNYTNLLKLFTNLLKDFLSFIPTLNINSFLSLKTNTVFGFFNLFTYNNFFLNLIILPQTTPSYFSTSNTSEKTIASSTYITNTLSYNNLNTSLVSSFAENSSS
jgi:hypothetical protein